MLPEILLVLLVLFALLSRILFRLRPFSECVCEHFESFERLILDDGVVKESLFIILKFQTNFKQCTQFEPTSTNQMTSDGPPILLTA